MFVLRKATQIHEVLSATSWKSIDFNVMIYNGLSTQIVCLFSGLLCLYLGFDYDKDCLRQSKITQLLS